MVFFLVDWRWIHFMWGISKAEKLQPTKKHEWPCKILWIPIVGYPWRMATTMCCVPAETRSFSRRQPCKSSSWLLLQSAFVPHRFSVTHENIVRQKVNARFPGGWLEKGINRNHLIPGKLNSQFRFRGRSDEWQCPILPFFFLLTSWFVFGYFIRKIYVQVSSYIWQDIGNYEKIISMSCHTGSMRFVGWNVCIPISVLSSREGSSEGWLEFAPGWMVVSSVSSMEKQASKRLSKLMIGGRVELLSLTVGTIWHSLRTLSFS